MIMCSFTTMSFEEYVSSTGQKTWRISAKKERKKNEKYLFALDEINESHIMIIFNNRIKL